MEQIRISTEFIKLDGFLKFTGIASTGGEAKEIIGEGLILVNGTRCTSRGKKLFPGDQVTVCLWDEEGAPAEETFLIETEKL